MAKTSRQTYNKKLLEAIVKGGATNYKAQAEKSVRTKNGPSESQIQQDCMRWFYLQYPKLAQEGMLFHIPNEGIRLGRMGARVKREGVVRGVADLCLCVPRGGYAALYIEMKKPGSYQRPEQKEWQKNVEKYGNKYIVSKSVEDFKKQVTSYLNGQMKREVELKK